MATETLTGSFADAAFADRPPDGTDPGVADPIPGVREQPKPAEKPVEKPAAEKPFEKPAEKSADKPAESTDLDNPHLSAKTEKKVETTEVSAEMPAELKKGMTDAAAAKAEKAWKSRRESEEKWRTEAETAKTALTSKDTELEGLKKQVSELQSLKTELESTKKTLAGYEQEMSVTRVEGTKAYKDSVTAPMSEITATVEDLAKRYEITPDSILRAIQEPDKTKRTEALDELIEDFKQSDKVDVVQAARDYHRIQKVAAEMRENAGTKLKELTEAEKAEQDQLTSYNVDLYKTSLSDAFKQLQDRVPYVRSVEGKDGWNNYLKGLLRDAEGVDVNNLQVPAVARAIVAERMLPDIAKVATHFEAKWKEAEAKLADAEKKLDARTKLSAGAGGGNGTTEKVASKDQSFVGSVF